LEREGESAGEGAARTARTAARRGEEAIYCPACRTNVERGDWRLVLRFVQSSEPGLRAASVLRHRLCGGLAYCLVERGADYRVLRRR